MGIGARQGQRIGLIGLTGGIGSGKSTVSRTLASLGAVVIDADQLAREVVAPGSEGLAEIESRFGASILTSEGALDRPKLGALVFENAQARADLNAITHPRVSALAMQRYQEAKEAGAEVIVYDVPLLYEVGLDKILPTVVVVWVDEKTQRDRVAARDGLDEAAVQARIAAQMPLSEKAKKADHVIDNNGDRAATEAQVRALYRTLGTRGTSDEQEEP